MPTYSQNVSFSSPQALLAPDLSVEQQQAQRAQDLAAALRQMSLEPIDAGKGNIAWTQGAAKLAQALAGRIVQNRADKQQMKLNQAFAGRMGSMFGTAGGGGQASGGGGAPSPPPSISPPQAASPAPPMTPSVLQPPMRPQADPLAPMPDPNAGGQPPQMAPQQPPPMQAPMPQQEAPPQEAPQQAQRGPWSLSGDPRQDMSAYMMNPEEYGKAVIASHAPTDIAKMMMQAGIDPSSALGHQIMQAQIAKQNYIAPINGRPGATIRDPSDPTKVLGYDAPSINGAFPVYGPDGMPSGYQQAPGASQAMGAVAAAEAGGKGAGGAPFELVTVVDQTTGAKYQVPKSQLLGGAGTPSAGSPPAGGGSLNSYYGRGAPAGKPSGGPALSNQSDLGPQGQNAATTAGTNSANGFQSAIDEGVKAKDASRSIDLILTAAKGLPTGAGSDTLSTIKSRVNAFTTGVGGGPVFNTANIAKFDEIKKNAANLAAQLSSGAGQTGTDARLNNAIQSLPNAHYSPAAIQEVGLNLKGLAAAANARSIAAANWQQQHGPGSYSQFQSTWQKAYNPDLFYHVQKGDLAAWAKGMSATARARVLDQYRSLKALGAQF